MQLFRWCFIVFGAARLEFVDWVSLIEGFGNCWIYVELLVYIALSICRWMDEEYTYTLYIYQRG